MPPKEGERLWRIGQLENPTLEDYDLDRFYSIRWQMGHRRWTPVPLDLRLGPGPEQVVPTGRIRTQPGVLFRNLCPCEVAWLRREIERIAPTLRRHYEIPALFNRVRSVFREPDLQPGELPRRYRGAAGSAEAWLGNRPDGRPIAYPNERRRKQFAEQYWRYAIQPAVFRRIVLFCRDGRIMRFEYRQSFMAMAPRGQAGNPIVERFMSVRGDSSRRTIGQHMSVMELEVGHDVIDTLGLQEGSYSDAPRPHPDNRGTGNWIFTHKTMNPRVRAELLEWIEFEERRRSYSEDRHLVTTDDAVLADWYVDEELGGDGFRRMWPSRVSLLERPEQGGPGQFRLYRPRAEPLRRFIVDEQHELGPRYGRQVVARRRAHPLLPHQRHTFRARARVAGGGWLPFYFRCFENAPEPFRVFLRDQMQVYVNYKYLLSALDKPKVLRTQANDAGCWLHAVKMCNLLSADELRTLTDILLQATQHLGGGHRQELDLHQIHGLVNRWRCAAEADLKPPVFRIKYTQDGSKPLEGRKIHAGLLGALRIEDEGGAVVRRYGPRPVAHRVYYGPEIPRVAGSEEARFDVSQVRLLAVGLTGGHYFWDRSTEDEEIGLPKGIRHFGLRYFLDLPAERRPTAAVAFGEMLAWSSVRVTDRRVKPMSTFEFMRTMMAYGEQPTNVQPISIEDTRRYDCDAVQEEFRAIPVTYPEKVARCMTRPMRNQSRAMDLYEMHAEWRNFVYDTEDTPNRHELYGVAACEVLLDAPNCDALEVRAWRMPMRNRTREHLAEPIRGGVLDWMGLRDLSDEAVEWLTDESRRRRRVRTDDPEDEGACFHIPLETRWGWSRKMIDRLQCILGQPRESRSLSDRQVLRSAVPFPRGCRAWCHHLTYDFAPMILMSLAAGGRVDPKGFLPKGGRVVSCAVFFPRRNVMVYFVDSHRLFGPAVSVARMPAIFNFAADERAAKQKFLHDWMADDVIIRCFREEDGVVPKAELSRVAAQSNASAFSLQAFPFDEFWEGVQEDWLTEDGASMRLWDYAMFYCSMDVRVTAMALIQFTRQLLAISQGRIHALRFLSASSVADGHYRRAGCYEGVVELDGVLSQGFFRNFVIGGRCTSAFGWKRFRVEEPVTVLDATSLYPSAMVAMGGFLMGPPKPIDVKRHPTMAEVAAQKWSGYFVMVYPLAEAAPAPHEYSIGMIARQGEGDHGTLNWINDIRLGSLKNPDRFIPFDDISFPDYLEHQPMYRPSDFQVQSGYYFDGGRNPKIVEHVRALFELRKQAKDSGQKTQIKLLLNGAWGKAIQHPVPRTTHVFADFEEAQDYAYQHFAFVESVYPLCGTGEQAAEPGQAPVVLDLKRPLGCCYQRTHIGAQILSQARQIMNRVTCRLYSPDDPACLDRSTRQLHNPRMVLYTDTDSIHLTLAALAQIEAHIPMGSDLGHFHCDLADGAPHGVRGIWNDKKNYCIELPGETLQYALKGIPRAAMALAAHQRCGRKADLWEGVFEPLFRGECLTFALSATDAPCGGAARPNFVTRRFDRGFQIVNCVNLLERRVRVRLPPGEDDPILDALQDDDPPPDTPLVRSYSV